MIVAVSSILDEAGIIGETVGYLLDQGVDKLLISDGGSTDGTQEILAKFPEVELLDQTGPFDQGAEITRLSRMAYEQGAEWVVPFDADEFWWGVGSLRDLPTTTTRVYATMWQHVDRDYRHLTPKPLPKVAFRPNATCVVEWGNHNVRGVPGNAMVGLVVKELQYRDFEHFCQKIEKARRLHASWDIPEQYGSHMRVLFDADLEATWNAMQAVPTTYDPIRGAEWT